MLIKYTLCEREFLIKRTLYERKIPKKGFFFASHTRILRVLECPPPPGIYKIAVQTLSPYFIVFAGIEITNLASLK